jgi:N-acetylglucosamine-6-phosphate deacetylase
VTAYQPTLITSAEAATVEALQTIPASSTGPRVLGAHLEGPFLSPERPGTHPLEHLRAPDVELLDRLLDAGQVTQMTLAPELPGADALVERLRERGVTVSAGHTNATAAEAHRAFDLGVAGITHVFNAMRPFRSRDPGIAGAALTRPGVVIGMVVDGHHLADETVRLVWGCAAGRVALVTDAIAAAGIGPDGGTFQLGDVAVEVGVGAAPMREDGTLAGTVLTMIDAVRNLHALGVSFEEAVGAATEVPARFLARGDVGFLEPGALADVVVLDDRLEILSVLCAGRGDVVARD